jgi:hypothetical protein
MRRSQVDLASLATLVLCVLAYPRGGLAADPADAGAEAGESTSQEQVPLACDGALCETTNGATCNAAKGLGHASWEPSVGVAALAVVGALARRQSRRKECASDEP